MLLLAIGALTVKGVIRGFFREAFGLLAVVAGVGAAVVLGPALARQWTPGWFQEPLWAQVAAHATLFLGPYLALHAVGLILNRLGRAVLLGGVDRGVGAVFGALAGAIVSGAALAAAQRAQVGTAWLADSRLARPLTDVFSRVLDLAQSVGP